jgi:1,2-diacylglycerol-3-alpha-glucose alpha-1,2-glucosyltransferase
MPGTVATVTSKVTNNAPKKRLKILFVHDLSLIKRISRVGTAGGIESNYKAIVKGLIKRGHIVRANTKFPPGEKPDLVVTPTFGTTSLYNMWRYRVKYQCACVIHGHTTVEDMKGGFLPEWADFFGRMWLSWLYFHAHTIITPSNYSRQCIRDMHLYTQPPIFPVSNGVNLAKFSYNAEKRAAFRKFLAEKFCIDITKPVVLGVGLAWKRKGIDTFHHMARVLPGYEFVWVGDYKLFKNFEKTYVTLPNLTFTGFVDDIVAAYCGADVFFFPSYTENQGIPLLEASACKVPIVCRNLPTYDFLQDRVNCLKGETERDFRNLLREVVENKTLRDNLVHNASENIQEHDSEKILNKVESLYLRTLRLFDKVVAVQSGAKQLKRRKYPP